VSRIILQLGPLDTGKLLSVVMLRYWAHREEWALVSGNFLWEERHCGSGDVLLSQPLAGMSNKKVRHLTCEELVIGEDF
jgi:hypothetical protein